MRVDEAMLERLNEKFGEAAPKDILAFARETFGVRVAMLSSMQRAGTLLAHMADRAGLDFDVLFVDTGVLHPETLATRDAVARTHRHLRVITLHPAQTFAAQTRARGLLYLSRDGQESCCDLRKSEPLRTVRGRYDALVGALRRSDSGARSRVQTFALDPEMNVLRIHPFARTTDEEFSQYERSHPDVIVHPLHAMGFKTIGCFPCTTPVRDDEPERAGRWRHLAGVEYCGINPTDVRRGNAAIELDERYRLALA